MLLLITLISFFLRSITHSQSVYFYQKRQKRICTLHPILELSAPHLHVVMIIKGLCGRYERWNPVHPTYGSFWGMGVGFGCGVGWGPGFGPEVIGYVGAGCGVGFSVGITLAGFGIGLPANYLYEVPYKALMATASGLNEFGSITGNSWNIVEPHISDFQRKMSGRVSSFKHDNLFDKGVDLSAIKDAMSSQSRLLMDNLQKTCDRICHPNKGSKD